MRKRQTHLGKIEGSDKSNGEECKDELTDDEVNND